MIVFYILGIRAYTLIIWVASFFNEKAKDWIVGRKNVWKSLPDVTNREVYWFHCASLGEFDQGLPVMNHLKEEKPNAFILVTFFSPSGYNHFHKRKNPVDFACYLPTDSRQNAIRFVKHFNPKVAFFVKYEFWKFHVDAIKQNGTKLYSISTNLRSNQHFFKWYGGFFRAILMQFDFFFVQNKTTEELLKSIKINQVLFTGDTRFDRVVENKDQLVVDQRLASFVGESNSVFIAGSTWKEDILLLKELIGSNRFEKYIIAPHNVDEKHVTELTSQLQCDFIRYSDQQADLKSTNVIVVDTIGLLASAYSFGHVAYVGGGFSGSLHNILEPAVFGLPVVFGPKFSRFPEATAFINAGIGFSVKDQSELNTTLDKLTNNRQMISSKSIAFVEANQGATVKILNQSL